MLRHPALALTLALAAALGMAPACAHEPRTGVAPEALQVRAELPALPGVADLKFREFYAMPIGPKGLVPSARLLALNGQRVRVVGYMARQDAPTPGLLIASPLPVALGDEDERLADDLPATTLYVHLATAQAALALPYLPGLLQFTGVLRVGALNEADGRLSFVRMELDPDLSSALAHAAAQPSAR